MLKFKENKRNQKENKTQRGITLIALVISVIVLLILAGVSISAITGNESAMEKAKQARSANEAGGEEDTIKLAVVSAMSKGTYGLVEGPNLASELTGLVTSTAGIADNSAGPWTVQAKNSKIQYEISQYGEVTKKSGISLDLSKIEFTGTGSESQVLTATLTSDLSGTIEWSIPENNGVATISSATGNEITVTRIETPTKKSTTITATLQGDSSKTATCTVTLPSPNVKDAIEKGTSFATNTEVEDKYGNTIIVPAGFKIVEGQSVKDGIVIQDVSAGKAGSEFVWIPVGTFKTGENSTETVNLTRYDYSSGSPRALEGGEATKGWVGANDNQVFFSELTTGDADKQTKARTVTSTVNNETITEIEAVKQAVAKGGFYIGRYEMGTNYCCKADQEVQVQIARGDASTSGTAVYRAQHMYTGNTSSFKSDLVNSYVWDTTIDFIRRFGTNDVNTSSEYAYQCGKSTTSSSKAQAGNGKLLHNGYGSNPPVITNPIEDKQCNIYDMAGNVYEWTTEYSSSTNNHCVSRGGYYNNTNYYTACRDSNYGVASDSIGFRPLLYIM